MNYNAFYSREFYSNRRKQTIASANRILGIVNQFAPFRAVADIGCGTGTWLSAALELGAERVFGLEGEWVTPEMLDDSRINFRATNLEERFTLPETVDLAISLEVAEHLTPRRAESFVEDLCSAAPRVLFSAAIPGQGGDNHLNEQWQSYWAALFKTHGYKPVDLVRPRVWTEMEIPWWYRQNCILYLAEEAIEDVEIVTAEPMALDVVHPDQFQLARNPPGIRVRAKLAAEIPRLVLSRLIMLRTNRL